MPGVGTITAAEMFSEQVEPKARTTDPANAEPGEYWVRTDQTSSDPQVVAELRRQDTSGVTKIPLFASSEESNLGSEMARGPSVVLDDGSVGFIAQTTDSGAKFGSPRVVTASGIEYLSHNSLTLSNIPDSENYWPIKEQSFPLENLSGSEDLTAAGAPTLVDDADYIEGVRMDLDGVDDGAESSAESSSGSMSWAITVDWSGDITDIQTLHMFGQPGTTANARILRFRGDDETNRVRIDVENDSSNYFNVNTVVSPGRHRIAAVLDVANTELRLGVDGSVANTTSISGSFQGTNTQHAVGYDTVSDNRYFGGTVDEPRHSGFAWDGTELQDDYDRQPWS